MVVRGKSGRRIVKLNSQAKEIIHNQDELWNYSNDYVSNKFKKEVRRLGIRNARFHDLRRTFGLNLIKQGMSIYKVSNLLGHKSVRTTVQHYAPLHSPLYRVGSLSHLLSAILPYPQTKNPTNVGLDVVNLLK